MTYWLIGVPTERSKAQVLQNLQPHVSRHVVSSSLFNVPDLKVGTLDTLMRLSDDLGKVDSVLENLVKKLERTYYDHAGQQGNQRLAVDDVPLSTYLTNFVWNQAKFPLASPLATIIEMIRERAGKDDEELKARNFAYNEIKSQLSNYEKKEQSNLVLRPLHGIVTQEHIIESEHLATVLVVIARANNEKFLQTYESLVSDWVVPRSARLITEQGDYILYGVLVFKKALDSFKNACREQRFVVRDFNLDEKEASEFMEARPKLEAKKNTMRGDLLLWCSTAYSETFISWTHLKAIRLFVESVLRFGLPVNFTAILLQLEKRNERKVREALAKTYSHLGNQFTSGTDSGPASAAEFGVDSEFYPYVSLTIETESAI